MTDRAAEKELPTVAGSACREVLHLHTSLAVAGEPNLSPEYAGTQDKECDSHERHAAQCTLTPTLRLWLPAATAASTGTAASDHIDLFAL